MTWHTLLQLSSLHSSGKIERRRDECDVAERDYQSTGMKRSWTRYVREALHGIAETRVDVNGSRRRINRVLTLLPLAISPRCTIQHDWYIAGNPVLHQPDNRHGDSVHALQTF